MSSTLPVSVTSLPLDPSDLRDLRKSARRVLDVGCTLLDAHAGAYLVSEMPSESPVQSPWISVGDFAREDADVVAASAPLHPGPASSVASTIGTVLYARHSPVTTPRLLHVDGTPDVLPSPYDWALLLPFSSGSVTPSIHESSPVAGGLCFLGRTDAPTKDALNDAQRLVPGLASEAWARHSVATRERRYRSFIEESQQGIYRVRLYPPIDTSLPVDAQIDALYDAAVVAECNPILAQMYGYDTPDELVGRSVEELHGGTDVPENVEANRALIQNNYVIADALSHETDRDGNRRSFSNTVFGIVRDGLLHHLWGIQMDVTERVRQQRQISTYNEALRDLSKFQAGSSQQHDSPLARILTTAVETLSLPYGRIYLSPPYASSLTRETRPEPTDAENNAPLASGRSFSPEAVQRVLSTMDDMRIRSVPDVDANPDGLLSSLLRTHGLRSALLAPVRAGRRTCGFVLVGSSSRAHDWGPETHGFVASISDFVSQTITWYEQEEATAALKRSEQRWRSLVESHPGGVVISINGTFAYANAAAARIIGAEHADDVIGRRIEDLELDAEESGPAEIARERSRTVTGGRPTDPWEHTIVGFDGEKRVVVTQSVPVTYKGHRAAQTVIRDVTERRRREEELRQAKDRAQEMNRLKSSFLANMSHEIRTPLTSVIGFSEVLSQKDMGEDSDIAEMINASGQRLLRTLNSVLDLSRLQAGAHPMSVDRLDLVAFTTRIVDLFRQKAQQAGLTLSMDLEPPDADATESGTPRCPVRLDSGALDRILTNLLGNAVKFTNDGGCIDVTLRWTDTDAELRVADTGIGIDSDFLPHIFEAFHQESSGTDRSHEGTGLGLAITKQLLELMDGEIEVDSTKGEGTTFTVALPREMPDPPETESPSLLSS